MALVLARSAFWLESPPTATRRTRSRPPTPRSAARGVERGLEADALGAQLESLEGDGNEILGAGDEDGFFTKKKRCAGAKRRGGTNRRGGHRRRRSAIGYAASRASLLASVLMAAALQPVSCAPTRRNTVCTLIFGRIAAALVLGACASCCWKAVGDGDRSELRVATFLARTWSVAARTVGWEGEGAPGEARRVLRATTARGTRNRKK